MTQKEKEAKNRETIESLVNIKDEFVEYYYSHTNRETMERYGIEGGTKILLKALKACKYDPTYKRNHNVMKGRKSTRSHESYVQGGKKSSDTQKKSWQMKSDEERESWKQLMKDSHGEEFCKKISLINKNYQAQLSDEERKEKNAQRSISCSNWWKSLPPDKKKALIQSNIDHGAGWNHEKIRQTTRERYGVDNIAQLDSVKKKYMASINRTCLEKYGVMWCCQLQQCNDAIGSKGKHTKPNEGFAKLLDIEGLDYSREFVIPGLSYRYDFNVGGTLVEINPTPFHNSTFNPKGKPKSPEYHQEKSIQAFTHGFKCIQVFDWDDPLKVVSLLKKRTSIGARECNVVEVSREDAMTFINKNHIQGYARDKVRLGLSHNGEIVSIMTFNKPRYNKNYEWELIRYCSSMNITGGASKLFKHFIDKYKPSSVITYCDKSKFSGDIYSRLGFTLLRKGKPSKHWYNARTHEHYTDNLIRQQGFSRVVEHRDASTDDSLTTNNNRELMLQHGFVEIYDCGQDTFEYKPGGSITSL